MSKTPFIFLKRSHHSNLLKQYSDQKDRITAAATFIDEIEKGNLDAELSLRTDDSDQLTQSLVSLQKQMIQVSLEERRRSWVAEHRSQFIDILRNRNIDLGELGDSIISHLVKYLEANQGALYVVNETDGNMEQATIDMLACYAYGRKKFTEQKIAYGQGLGGQAILEKDTIYISEIPEDYTRITSGLGEATPRYLLIVPLKIDDKVYGAVEIASFKNLEPYQIEFAEQLGESIASTLANTKNNERTQLLLKETQIQAEEMRAQEEEMRQNMEELQATQEEMSRKANEIESRLQAIDESGIASIEFELDGTILSANKNFLKLMGYTLDDIRGRHHRMFISDEYAATEEYRLFWESLGKGEAQMGEYKRYAKGDKPVYIQGSYSILRNEQGKPEKVLKLAADITSAKLAEEKSREAASEMESRLQAINESGIASIEFDLSGNILSANTNFLS
ncbi:MAG: PAS domain S-box protein, partial [Cyclobacteriaceae bacterium]